MLNQNNLQLLHLRAPFYHLKPHPKIHLSFRRRLEARAGGGLGRPLKELIEDLRGGWNLDEPREQFTGAGGAWRRLEEARGAAGTDPLT